MIDVTSVSYKFDQNYHRFADYMGIDPHKRNDFEVAKKLALLYDWAKTQTNSEKFSKVVGVVEKARKTAGVSFTGETLVNFLHQRISVELDGKRAKVEAEPSKRERYDIKGSSDRIKDSAEGVEKARHEAVLAKRRNVDYIKRTKESKPKAKPETIPTIDAIGYVPLKK